MALLLAAVPRSAFACPVCFGNSDAPMALAMNAGIFMMLLVVAGILSVFAYFFLNLMRRAKIAAAKEMSEGIAQ